ncbi:MAG: response regulator transcription factor [Verrucomicrobiia bacterium]
MNHPDSTIFIIDDDPSARKGLSLLVRSAGWKCEAFASARDFLARPAFSGTGCLILDVCMPGMSGLELRDSMATKDPLLPIVFLTGHGDVSIGVDAMKKGAVDFLQKPVSDESLLQAISCAVERHATAKARQQQLERVQGGLQQLTPRERQVLEYVIGGWLNKQIAAELQIAERTVKIFRGNLMHKLRVNSVADLVRQCEIAGIVPRAPL